MASVFDQASAGVQQVAQGAVRGAKSFVNEFVGADVKGPASDLLAGDLGGAVDGAKAFASEFAGAEVTGTVSDLLSGDFAGAVEGAKAIAGDVLGVVSGTSAGDLVQDIGGQIIGAASAEGGVIGTVAGIVGGVLGNNMASKSWGRLNPKLLANLFACDSKGAGLLSEPLTVVGAISEATIEFTYNWQSPFENTGPESKAPALMAMLQTGQLGTVINALQTVLPEVALNAAGGMLDEAANKAKEVSRSLEGRTGITRLNSRQVFSGMPPIKINLTLHLRALRDPEREINEPYQRLLRWSLPQQLADDSTLTGILKKSGDTAAMVKALFPSMAPLMVGFTYGGQTFKPMVIESISNPLDSPRYRDGNYVYLPVQMTLATLTALDRNDVLGMFT